MTVDGAVVPVERSHFAVDGRRLAFSDVCKERPATLTMNREATISVQGFRLSPGPHRVNVGFVVLGLGELRFDLVDTLADA